MIIIHLSDIHRSRVILEKLGELSDKSDLLIVSGDVTTFGESSYFQEFMKFVSELKVRTFYVPGNNDKPDFSVPKGIENLDGRKIDFSGLSFGGLGGSPPTPFNTPYEVEEEELENGGHAGSRAVSEYIAEFKPKLVLCGHVHEAVSKFRLGDSLVINPGAAVTRRYAKIKFEDEITATLSVF